MKKIIIFCVLLGPVFITKAVTLTVGPGNDCGFPNILTALNFAGSGDTIMIAEGTYSGVEAKLYIDKSLNIWGGLDSNCQVFTANRTYLQLDDIGPVLEIDVSGGETVSISGLDISGAQHDNFNDYDGGIYVYGNGTLNIENSHIHDNESFFGGGISVRSGAQLNLSGNTEIYRNASSDGGGIFCGSSTISAYDTVIGKFADGIDKGNTVAGENGQGGGISALSCTISLGNTLNGNGPVDISYNKSANGAGIYAHNSILTFHHEGSRLSFNELANVSGDGNSLLLSGTTFAQLSDLEISDNKFTSVISVQDTASFVLGSVCANPPCTKIMRNTGSIFRFTGGSSGTVHKTLVVDNTNSSIVDVVGQTSVQVDIDNSVFANNTLNTNSSGLIFSNFAGTINLNNVTLAHNNNDEAIFYTLGSGAINFDGGIIWGNTATSLLHSNNQGNVVVENSVIQYDTFGMVNTIQADPLFANPASGNFHIQGDSPAVDHFVGTLDSDFENDTRPQGAMDDAGADEFKDLIFADGFEL